MSSRTYSTVLRDEDVALLDRVRAESPGVTRSRLHRVALREGLDVLRDDRERLARALRADVDGQGGADTNE